MRLRLNVRTPEGKREAWTYDNEENKVCDGAGKLLDLSDDERVKKFAMLGKKRAPVFSKAKQKKMSNLRIQLGLKCNMHCRYCAQEPGRAIDEGIASPKQVPAFLEMLKKGGIDCNGGWIEFWGGEPFVYWKTLVVLIPALRELYPKARFGMISNGTLLDEEKIAFCEKYGVSITFSHDAQGYRLRGKDPLDDPKMVDLWRLSLQKLGGGVNCVLSPANTNIDEIADFVREKLGDVHLNFEGIMTHVGVTDGELMFSDAQLLELQKNIFRALTNENWDKFPALTSKCVNLIEKLAKRKKIDPRMCKCCMNMADNAAVDLAGNFLSCHDRTSKINWVGRIEDPEKVDISKHFRYWSERPECRKCLVLSMCRGSCPQIEGLARTLTCKNEFAYHFAIFQAAFWLLFGITIESYGPV